MKKIFVVVLSCLIVFSATVSAFAVDYSTYNDISQSSANVQNLISYAINIDGFDNSDFVVAQVGQYKYSLFFGDLTYSGSSVTGSDVTEVSYYRSGDYSSSYQYSVSNLSTLNLSVNNVVVSNIDSLGMNSSLYDDYNYQNTMVIFFIIIVAILFVLMCVKLRRS